ncbi:MAG: DUF3857 domain-containing protein [Proteobacteria bacterium]|nr:DUF3857 domain-containing protein [Pseudomonadota bacterium]
MQIQKWVRFLIFIFVGLSSDAFAQDLQSHQIKKTVFLNEDYTYTKYDSFVIPISNLGDIPALQSFTYDFFPDSQDLEVDAYVIHPDGEKLKVPSENITIERSLASQDAPGFTNSRTMRVLFPELQVSSTLYITWKITQKKPLPFGYTSVFSPPFYQSVANYTIEINLPKSLKLFWKERGGFKVEDFEQNTRRIITAELKNILPHVFENSMVDPLGFAPIFVVSSFETWEEMAAQFYETYRGIEDISPEIRALSNKIVQGKKGKEAIQLIYNWITQNIQYVAHYLNIKQEFIPHKAEEILKNGYGDCKDHVNLMRTLLKVQNIEAFPVLVFWGKLYNPFPLPCEAQFNHMMIYLPEFNIFANPTNALATLGVLGQGLDGKFVIIPSPEGKTAYLPMPKPDDNIYENKSSIDISSDGSIKGSNIIQAKGSADGLLRFYFSDMFSSEVTSLQSQANNLLRKNGAAGGYGDFRLSTSPYNIAESFIVEGSWKSAHELFFGDEFALFSIPLGLEIINPQLFKDQVEHKKRLYPFMSFYPTPTGSPKYIYPAHFKWSYEIKTPQTYVLYKMPQNVNLTISGGSYKSTYWMKEKTLCVERSLTFDKIHFQPYDYENLYTLIDTLEKDFNTILIYKKK